VASNDLIVLDSILVQKRKDSASTLGESEFFELFSFEQILKDKDLSYDELLLGGVDGGDDGGIDGFFIFINEELIVDEFDPETFKRNPTLELYIIQSKTSPNFKENAIEKLIRSAHYIFDLRKDIDEISKIYNTLLADKVETFRDVYVRLAGKHPTIAVKYFYASKGDSKQIHEKLHTFVDTLRKVIEDKLYVVDFSFRFWGARELLQASRQEKTYSLQLKFIENYISRGEDNYVILSSLRDYYDFITDKAGNLRKYVFESNVRDYQGNVEVNKDIRKTLDSDKSNIDFWWLNNGITILASKASAAGKVMTLDDVQIVNGLQTTNTIYEYVSSITSEADDVSMQTLVKVEDERALLIKIIVPSDPEARDRIIKATNFQTPVPAASLRATEPIQRDIEDFFLKSGWFYDRRKNYYKNIGKPSEKIVSIQYLAQAVTAILFKEPHNSKGRPTSLTKGKANYSRIFNHNIDIRLYLFCARIIKRLEAYLRSPAFNNLADTTDFAFLNSVNMRGLIFHLAMLYALKLTNKTDYSADDLKGFLDQDVSLTFLEETILRMVEITTVYLSRDEDLTLNKIVKREDFSRYVVDESLQ
jgi:hypothetical protein